MRCLVFAIAILFTGCTMNSQLGAGGPDELPGSSTAIGSETTVIWQGNQGRFPSVGYFDVETIFNENELGPGSYVRIAAMHITGTSRKALVGMLRLSAAQIGANRLLIVKVEEKKEEVYLYSGLDNVARFFSQEKTDFDRRDEAYTLRIDAIAIRQSDDLSTVHRSRPEDPLPTVYQPYRPIDRPTVNRPTRRIPRPSGYRLPRRDDRRTARPPRTGDEPPGGSPSPPKKQDPPPDRTPSPRDAPSNVKPPPPPPEDDRSSLKRPRMKTHRP